jgi:hypothetical protein
MCARTEASEIDAAGADPAGGEAGGDEAGLVLLTAQPALREATTARTLSVFTGASRPPFGGGDYRSLMNDNALLAFIGITS